MPHLKNMPRGHVSMADPLYRESELTPVSDTYDEREAIKSKVRNYWNKNRATVATLSLVNIWDDIADLCYYDQPSTREFAERLDLASDVLLELMGEWLTAQLRKP